jgi:PAS domain S-box-containing protein
VWDIVCNEVWVSEEGRSFFGWEQSEVINLARFIDTLHPDDREPTRQAINRSLEPGNDYDVEYRVLAHAGAIRWIAARGAVEFSTDGKPLRMRGVAIDITERKHSEEALKNERSFLRQVIDTDPNFIFAKDREGRFTLAIKRSPRPTARRWKTWSAKPMRISIQTSKSWNSFAAWIKK